MKTLLILIQICLLPFFAFSQNLSAQNDTEEELILSIETVKTTKAEWQFEITIQNSLKKTIYLTTAPTQVNGEKGVYLQLDKKIESQLKIGSRIYPPPFVVYYSNSTYVNLKSIKPNGIFTEIISLKFPLRETSPPNYNYSDELWTKLINNTHRYDDFKNSQDTYHPFGKNIIPENINSIVVSYGYFVSSNSDWKETYDFQKIISSDLIQINIETEK